MASPEKKRKTPSSAVSKPARSAASKKPQATASAAKSAQALVTEPLALKEGLVPSAHAPQASAPFTGALPSRELPHGYGDNLIRAQVRDPNYIYTYWEIRAEVEAAGLAKLGGDRSQITSVLRVYDLTEDRGHKNFFDIPLQNMAVDWTIGVRPNHSYVIELGLLHRDGRFVALARSNEVTTPRDGMSDVLDEEWAGIDFDRIYALSGGFKAGLSSGEMRELMKRRLESALTSGSGGVSSPVKNAPRGFWFKLDCEVIVYGATEPGAKVTINGEEIKLNPDGTFSLRAAFPDGKMTFDARATSPDGVEERQIAPTVERTTKRSERNIRKNGKR